ncbi:M15 family metallopeptidase [Candidatus Kaiserbacteria bacterium]|nr:M15 family metallopeptidase [Candidatus Kaiserbacteria bacterium]
MLRIRSRNAVYASFSFGVLFFLLPFFALAQSVSTSVPVDTSASCLAGQTAITSETRALAHAAGVPDSSNCWVPTDANTGQKIAEAKQNLQGMWCGGSQAQCSFSGVVYRSSIDGLDPKFALCADKFMKQLRAQDPSACIRSAYRSSAHQMCSCQNICHSSSCPGLCAPPGGSYHQKGLAIDVNHPRVTKQILWMTAAQSGLGNPTGLHNSDPDHIQVMTGGTDCSDIGYSPTDTDTFVPGPAVQNPYANYTPQTNPFQNPNTPYMQPTPQPQTPTPQQPVQPQQCPVQSFCSGNTLYNQDASCAYQTQQCQYGCSGNQCAPAPTPTTTPPVIPVTPTSTPTTTPPIIPISTTTPTTTPIGTTTPETPPEESPTPSWIDIIRSFAGVPDPNTSSSTDTSRPVDLNSNLSDVSQYGSMFPQSDASGTPTYVIVQGVIAPETFSTGPTNTNNPTLATQNPTLLNSLLSQLRLALQTLIITLATPRPGVPSASWSPSLVSF